MESNLQAQFQKYFSEKINKTYNELLHKINHENKIEKELEIEIKCPEKEINGISIEMSTFDKNKFYEFFNKDIDYLKNSTIFLSIEFELKDEKNLQLIKFVYESLKTYFKTNSSLKNLEILFRKNGKKIIYDVFSNSPQDILNNIGALKLFHLIFKSKFNFDEDKYREESNLFFDLFTIFFSLKLKYDSIFILSLVLESMKLMINYLENDLKEKVGNYLNIFQMMIRLLDKTELKLEFDNRDLSNIILSNNNIKDEIIKIIKNIFQFLKEYKNGVNKLMNNNFYGINKEYLSVTFGLPKKDFGFNLSMKIPGLNTIDEK